jgi:hypothetical protein
MSEPLSHRHDIDGTSLVNLINNAAPALGRGVLEDVVSRADSSHLFQVD